MEAEKINIEDWHATGRGGFADSYFNNTDDSLLLKLNFIEYTKERAYSEFERSKAVFDAGLPCPEPLKFVTDGERYGLISRRIVGKRSLTRIISEEPERIDEMARTLAEMAKNLHNTPCNTSLFHNAKDRYRKAFNTCGKFPEDVLADLNGYIDEMADVTTCLHFDLHPGNVITARGRNYWIDLGGFAYGDPDIDFGILVAFCEWTPKKVLDDLLHITRKQCRTFTRLYGEYYYGEQFKDPALQRKLYHAGLLTYALTIKDSKSNISPLMVIFRGKRLLTKLLMTLLDLAVKEKQHD